MFTPTMFSPTMFSPTMCLFCLLVCRGKPYNDTRESDDDRKCSSRRKSKSKCRAVPVPVPVQPARICIYIYIYVYRERERFIFTYLLISLFIYRQIDYYYYIYIYIAGPPASRSTERQGRRKKNQGQRELLGQENPHKHKQLENFLLNLKT